MVASTGAVTPRHKLAALGLFLGLLGIPLYAVFGAILTLVTTRVDLLTSLATEVAHDRQVIDAAPELRRRTAALLHDIAVSHAFYEDPTNEAASASLATNIKDVIEASHAELRSLTIRPAEKLENAARVAVEADLTVKDAQLALMVRAIQAHRPFLFVRHVAISPAAMGAGGDRLFVHLDVAAFRR